MKMDKRAPAKMDVTEEIDLLRILSLLYAHRYIIIISTFLISFLFFLFTLVKSPIYVANVLIQLESEPQSHLVNKLMLPLMNDNSASTEMGILKSRYVLSETIEDLGLQLEVAEKKPPVIGKILSLFGGEKVPGIAVAHFSVPEEYEDQAWALTVLTPDSYQVDLGENGVINGKTGETVSQNGFVINIKMIDSPPGTEYDLINHAKLSVINDLLNHLSMMEVNKDSGLLSVSFTGPDKKENSYILNGIAFHFIQYSLLKKTEETTKSLEFVNSLLPGVQQKLNEADNKLHLFQQENGSVDLPLEAKSILDSSVAIESQQNELNLAKADISKRYTKDHPVYRTLVAKESVLNKEKNKLLQGITSMPKKQQEFLSIKRDVESQQEIYMQLLAKQQELGITKASTVAGISIIDEAVSDPLPTGSKRSVIIVLGALLGMIASSGYILVMQFLRNPLDGIEMVENCGVGVLASIPLSKWLVRKNSSSVIHTRPQAGVWLAREYPEDLAIESLRSLRTGLFIALKQAKNNSIMLSGATPGAGKTFISSNLASLMADSGKSILLIDADLRRGYMHQLLGLQETDGLTEILQGKQTVAKTIQKTTQPGLDFISRGAVSSLSSELLMNGHFAQTLQWAQQHYDYVIVDTPPILAITDAAVIAQHVGLSLLVLRYKVNNMKDLKMALRRFVESDITLDGVVFNGVEKGSSLVYEHSYYSITP